nr:MAG: ORF1 [Torque teno midi virus]
MPFWWNRRRKYWWGRRYTRPKYRKYQRRRRRYIRRRKPRRTTRRRYRRRKKVRKKRKTLLVRQWQPDSIITCKIKGYLDILMGADGNQYLCYTQNRYALPPPKHPCGGGFSVDRFTLQWLYDQWRLRQNIWTKPNTYKDLCRFIVAKINFYRHKTTDFIVQYSRQPPFLIDKWTYMQYHPYMLLQSNHIKIIPSLETNPRGKYKKRVTIRPPKQMLSKWFFQRQFATADLFQIVTAACSLSYPRLGCCNENRTLTIYYLNPYFYQYSDWGQTKDYPNYYKPYNNIADLEFWSGNQKNPTKYKPKQEIEKGGESHTTSRYYASINYNTGYFSPKVLSAFKVMSDTTTESKPLPLGVARYNPVEDDGKGNEIWLASIHNNAYAKPAEDNLNFNGYPLWLAFWGYWSYLQKIKDKSFFSLHYFVVRSPYIYTAQTEGTKNFFPIIDWAFVQGKEPYDGYLTSTDKSLYYPTAHNQIITINNICKLGPYVPKYENDRLSTWELPIKYNFVFKWGGPHIADHIVENPKTQPQYDVPDHLQKTVQIGDPTKQKPETMFHDWDYRRGFITSTALSRMQQNLESDSSLSTDSECQQKKRKRVDTSLHHPEEKSKKIKTCLQELCKESTFQEEETPENLLRLIQQQQQQQRHLKHNLLTLIKDVKEKQCLLQLQTGIFE